MNFQQLRIIRETVRRNFNLTEVAAMLFTSQPGVSRQIRELEEELGVTPVVGDLLYVHNYTQQNGTQAVEFFFAVTNATAYRILGDDPTHAHELSFVDWVNPTDTRILRPVGVWADFVAGKLGDGQLRFLGEGVA